MTTGLIGTDRRPVPKDLPQSWSAELDQALDPAHAVLSLAARHRAVDRASGRLPSCSPGIAAPPIREPIASRPAHEILARLLSPPQVDLLNLWLATAAEHGQHASAAYWTPLAIVAARTTELDRTALAAALGDRGVWFVEQNPDWARLAKGLQAHPKEQSSAEPNDSGVEVTENAVGMQPVVRLEFTHGGSHRRVVVRIVGIFRDAPQGQRARHPRFCAGGEQDSVAGRLQGGARAA